MVFLETACSWVLLFKFSLTISAFKLEFLEKINI